MKLSRRHGCFIIAGAVLSVACIVLACLPCVEITTCIGITQETTVKMQPFVMNDTIMRTYIILSLLVMISLPFRNRIVRIIAVPVSLLQLVIPWFYIQVWDLVNVPGFAGKQSNMEWNAIPYVVTALSVVLLVQMIVMIFALPPKK